ncbi:hypothetical protein F5148DRAFT_1276825 [Russula earlei]|uniref:Uncharacterized protein n=1 Tax=Russula earlei TaxID=71964 RepID=A0ACC0U2A2_9AGAM|nr:hypothetical protein F5148DRAFT_1276825 [Russula earlei]
MCNLETYVTFPSMPLTPSLLTFLSLYGCGTKKLRKIDCNNRYCVWSIAHPQPVSLCQPCYCDKFFGPDAKETVTASTPEYCSDCHYWYRGPGQQRRR